MINKIEQTKEQKTIDDELMEFNKKFMESQQPLGQEFENILFDNLETMYD